MTILDLQNVSLVRGSIRILNDVSLQVSHGEHLALLGPNGCGKSTLLKLLMRVMYPSVVDGRSGSVRLFGETEWNVWDLRTRLGFISSELDQHFIGGRSGRLSVTQAVLTGFFSSELEPDPEHVTPSMRDQACRALDWMEIEPLRDRSVGHLSTGERRRVLLARAMIHQPQALILDEPTTGLDLRAQSQLLRILERLALNDTTLILVTHHFEELLPCIQRTVLMRSGEIVFDGPTTEAMNRARLTAVFETDLGIERAANGYWHVRSLS